MKKLLLLALLALAFLSAPALAKSFSIESADINVKILSDGSVDFSQKIAVNFIGSFSEGFVDLDLDSEQKAAFVDSSVSVREYGKEGDDRLTSTISTTSKGKTITWKISASNEKKTFTISYKLKKAVTAYRDVGEFNWKVWGSSWPSSVGKMKITVELPREVSNVTELRRWAHPQLNGKITDVDKKTILIEASNVPANQWVEARIVFPVGILSSTTEAKISASAGLQKILDEEERFGKESESEEEIPGIILFFAFLSVFGLPLVTIILFVHFYNKYGREPKPLEQSFIYYRDIPYKYGPAVAASILEWGTQQNDVTATFMDLVRRKFFKIEEVQKDKFLGIFGDNKDYIIANLNKPTEELKPYEKKVFDLFVENMAGGKISMNEFQSKVSSNYKYTNFFSEWQKLVNDEVKNLNLIDNTGRDKFLKWGGAILALNSILAFLSFGVLGVSLFISAAVFSALAFSFKGALPRRTQEGAEQYAKWAGLKKFLTDFGLMKEKMPKQIYLWDQYLVYATAFGIAEQVSKYMDTQFPVEQRRRSALYTGGAFGIYSSPMFRKTFSSFSAPRSSGHSGGFSGGGGHGGGGGGGGFR